MKSLRNNAIAFLAVIVAFIMSTDSSAQEIPPKPFSAKAVVDYANLLEEQQLLDLERKLCAYWDSTSIQMIVVTVPKLGEYTAFEYATELHNQWGIGDAEKNNGIVILVKPKSEEEYGDVFISVGYGLEGSIPDAYAKNIVDLIMIPHFKNNDYYAAIDEGTTDLMRLGVGQESEAVKTYEREGKLVIWGLILGTVLFVVVVTLLGKWMDKKGYSSRRYSSSSSGRRYSSSSSVIRFYSLCQTSCILTICILSVTNSC